MTPPGVLAVSSNVAPVVVPVIAPLITMLLPALSDNLFAVVQVAPPPNVMLPVVASVAFNSVLPAVVTDNA